MKVEIEVCGCKVAASSDYNPSGVGKDADALRAVMFARLCSEACMAAKEYISKINTGGRK